MPAASSSPPDHDEPQLEHVVERHAHYWIVEKHADPEASATDTLPCVGSGGPPSQVGHVAPPDHGLLPWYPKQHDPADE
jgi:hypothetical protein